MRNQFKSLLLRSVTRSPFRYPTTTTLHLQQVHRNFSHSSSFLGNKNTLNPDLINPRFRCFSYEPDVEPTKPPENVALTDILSKSTDNDEIKTGLESINLSISYDMVLNTLESLEEKPEIAWKFFNFVSDTQSESLSSKSYNLMLATLGRKDWVEEFWGLLEIMKKKGYGVSKRTFVRVSEGFEKEGMVSDFEKFKELYAVKPDENAIERVCSRVCKVVRENEWDGEVQRKLNELNCSWSSDLVAMVVEHLSVYPIRAVTFFWWVEENPEFKHSKVSYNAMIKVLSREDTVDRFWRIVEDMKGAGFEMDMEVYVFVMGRFYKRRMIKDTVDLYEFMMGGENKPSAQDSIYLLRKIVMSKDLDMDLFSRVVKAFTNCGNSLTESIFYSVVKSLISVERLQECGKVLRVLQKGGYVPTYGIYNRTISNLASVGRSDEAIEIIGEMEKSGCNPDFKTWYHLIHGQCVALDVEKASSSFQSAVEKFGTADAGYVFDQVINAYLQKKKAADALKFLSKMVDGTEFRPWHTTYKDLIEKLLLSGSLSEALSLIRLMKGNNYPPYLDPFIHHISKSGTGSDAMRFLRAVTDKRFASTSVFIRMFEAFFKARRHSEAQNFYSECPSSIRSHADVLNLFCVQKPEKVEAPAIAA